MQYESIIVKFWPVAFLLFSGPSVSQTTLNVAAASDLVTLQPALASSFGKNDRAVRLRFITGASGMLAQQIENSAPYDVFLSANSQFVDHLSSLGKLSPDSVRVYAIGRVAVLWRDKKHHPLSDLAQNWVRFVALPNPKLAPYGAAAEESIRHAGFWDQVRPKIVYGENVRQALQLFESGNADVVITANSLLAGRDPQIIPDDWHAPIEQKAGIVTGTTHRQTAEQFLEFLTSPEAQAIFGKFGFSSPKP
ncbi:MAG: molybdate ABC transporter substrate-binding protein [Acidobacteriaceae bacterium]|nr:molybdate ABC transporter substrate-binding protein [Acidobacteriaceae bacterium]MBV9501568.1 molybdate ABC transporter substrate-binding protein [Acidobacteriaceae bacterium]